MIPRQLALLLALLLSPLAADAVTLEDEVEAFLQVPAVVGREEPAAEFLEGRLAGLPVSRDALGNLTVTLGSGSPRRLVACPMGEPGYVVSRILDNGYLRLIPAGGAPRPALWDQSHFGQTVVIGGARGWIPGAVVLPSVHLMEGRSRPPEKPVAVDDLWVDVGAESSAEVEEMGVRLLDAVALVRRPSRIGGLVAAPSARLRGACMAAAEAARRVHASPGTGTTVFAWTTLDIFNQKGIEHLVRRMGPFGGNLLVTVQLGRGAVLRAMDNLNQTPRELIDRFLDLAERNGIPIQYGMTGGSSDGLAFAANGPEMLPFSWPGRYSHSPVEVADLRDVESLVRLVVAAITN
jgi:putative aminopeptidase FrvX